MKKIYVDDTNKAMIVCPKCGFVKTIDTTNYKETQKRLKANCKSGEVIKFTLEFRKHYRKDIRLHGEYIIQQSGEKGEVVIEDLSMSGIRFESLKPHQISTGDTLEVKFKLDNLSQTEIRKLVKVM